MHSACPGVPTRNALPNCEVLASDIPGVSFDCVVENVPNNVTSVSAFPHENPTNFPHISVHEIQSPTPVISSSLEGAIPVPFQSSSSVGEIPVQSQTLSSGGKIVVPVYHDSSLVKTRSGESGSKNVVPDISSTIRSHPTISEKSKPSSPNNFSVSRDSPCEWSDHLGKIDVSVSVPCETDLSLFTSIELFPDPDIQKQWEIALNSDVHLVPIITALKSNFNQLTPSQKRLVNRYSLHENKLYILRNNSQGQPVKKLVVPNSFKIQVIKLHHDENSEAHFGAAKTYSKISQKYFWSHLQADIASYIKTCHVCQVFSKQPKLSAPVGTFKTPRVFQLWSIDHQGPFTTTAQGNRYVLLAVESATRFVVAAPVPDTKAETTSRFLFDHIFCKFGFFEGLLSDNAAGFSGNALADLLQKLGIAKQLSLPSQQAWSRGRRLKVYW